MPRHLVAANGNWADLQYDDREKQIADDNLHIGIDTREKLEFLLDDGTISQREVDVFLHSARCFYDARSSLSLDGTLSSLITVKMATPEPCHRFEPPASLIARSKKVTAEYNAQHKKK